MFFFFVFACRFKELLDQHSVPYLLFFTAIRWSGLRLDLITNVTVTVTAALVMFLPNHISPAMGGLALAYAAMVGCFIIPPRNPPLLPISMPCFTTYPWHEII